MGGIRVDLLRFREINCNGRLRGGEVALRSFGIVVGSRERSFAATHVSANLAFARIWCGIVWVSMSVV